MNPETPTEHEAYEQYRAGVEDEQRCGASWLLDLRFAAIVFSATFVVLLLLFAIFPALAQIFLTPHTP